jgi:glycosyltransferase involved in cell wall biosynthesis
VKHRMSMRISVVIPCHNSEAWIDDALQSVAEQTHPADEVIVVDDASTDGSAEVARRSPVVTKVLTVAHRNAAAARNTGIEETGCEWVAFLDSDNRWHGDHLARAVAMLEESADSVFVAPPLPGGVSNDGQSRRRADYPIPGDQRGLTSDDFVEWRLRCAWGFPTTGIVALRSRLEQVGGFNVTQRRRHDFELFMRLIDGHSFSATSMATWWSRPPREGDISSNTALCHYFALRAFSLNQNAFRSARYQRLLRREARKAVTSALSTDDQDFIRSTMALAEPYLSFSDRAAMRLGLLAPRGIRKFALALRASKSLN